VLRRLPEAQEHHREALRLQGDLGDSAEGYLDGYVDLITDLQLDGAYEEALALLRQAEQSLGDKLPPQALATMMRLGAFLSECTGDYRAAGKRMKKALKSMAVLPDGAGANILPELSYSLLIARRQRLAFLQGRLPVRSLSDKAKARMLSLERHLTERLLRSGKWDDPLQMPQSFRRGLASRPWHDAATHFDARVLPLVELLEQPERVEALKAEFDAIQRLGLPQLDQECVQDAATGSGGSWSRFDITAVWNLRGAQTCSEEHTPKACSLLDDLRALAAADVIRAGYSAVGPGVWLRPHFGTTNAQLKLHLGLKVPEGSCAAMRVGAETRSWSRGRVLFFDDSFEHEVHNSCDAERVVFQVTIRHPDLPGSDQGLHLATEGH